MATDKAGGSQRGWGSSGGDPAELLDRLTQWEQLGQEVIMGQRAIVELDNRRQKCREAARALRRNTQFQGNSSWICLGSTTFMKLPTQKSIHLIEEDITVIDETIENTRDEQKRRVDELRRIEGTKDLSEMGFTLRAIS